MDDKKKFVPQENALMMFNRFLQISETEEQKTLILDMKQAFLELPTIEEIHAHWREDTFCSNCGHYEEDFEGHIIMSSGNYCSGCGAIMDERPERFDEVGSNES
jgi:translation initiation factor 2 beta subunit (eIF-2beta)/eIF-5